VRFHQSRVAEKRGEGGGYSASAGFGESLGYDRGKRVIMRGGGRRFNNFREKRSLKEKEDWQVLGGWTWKTSKGGEWVRKNIKENKKSAEGAKNEG